MHWEDRFFEQAAHQEALVARFQLESIGCSLVDWRNARRNGRWAIRSPRLIALRGSPRSEAQRVMEAVLDASPGAILHGPSALALYGLTGFDLRRIHVARPRGLRSAPTALAVVHRLRDLRPHDVIVFRGVVTETALRAIWCEADRYAAPALHDIGAQRVGRLLDNAHKLGLAPWSALHEMVDDLSERGRGGTVIMRALAEARPPGTSPTESRNEDRLEKILADAGADPLRRQVSLGGHEPIGRSDHRDDRLPLAVEVNSELHHTTPSDVAADTRRYRRLNEADFTVGVVWEADLWGRTDAVVRTIAVARRLAATGDRMVLHSPGCPWPDPLPHGHRRLDH